MRTPLLFLLLSAALSAQVPYDLLLKGGRVIDPKNNTSARRDVAIKDGKIAAVAASIDVAQARKTIDVSPYYVTPGLIDIHVHVYAGTGIPNSYTGDYSLYPDGFTFRNGVTTVVDAGTSGHKNFEDFQNRVISRSKTRVLAFLNIVGAGMNGTVEQNLADMQPEPAAQMAQKHKDVIVGIKTAHYAGPEWTAVDNAVKAGTLANIPVMVDFGVFRDERPYGELITKHLRPGDISTHLYLPFSPLLDAKGKLQPYLQEARKRGVIFDVGHGAGSFVFRQAIPVIQQGFLPDSISTDLHASSMNAGLKDMLSCMSKFLNMNVKLDDVIRMSTWNPAREIKHEELGHLSVGASADVAVLRVEQGKFGFTDSYGARLDGTQKLVAELTVRNGKVVYDLDGISREPWTKLKPGYLPQGEEFWDATLSPATRSRTK